MTDSEVGVRVARGRRCRGLSQVAVAGLMGTVGIVAEGFPSSIGARQMDAVAHISSDEATDLLDASC